MKLLLNTSTSLVKKLTTIQRPLTINKTIIRSESHLSTLRKKTGYALHLCKEALTKNSNDVTAAEKWLKEQAAKHGWAKVTKLQGRSTAEGLVGIYVNKESSLALALELNCETDFVARNDVFRNLIVSLTNKIASSDLIKSSISSQQQQRQNDVVTKIKLDQEKLDPFKEHLVTTVSQLGENLVLKQAIAVSTASPTNNPPVKLEGYAHAVGGQKNILDGIYLGKYGTLLAYCEKPQEDLDYEKEWLTERENSNKRLNELRKTRESEKRKRAAIAAKEEGQDVQEDEVDYLEDDVTSEDSSSLPANLLPKMLCQHIIGMRPTKVRYNQEELQEIRKLIELRKSSNNDEDEDFEALLDQKFIINNQIIRNVLKNSGIEVVDFLRIECGRSDS